MPSFTFCWSERLPAVNTSTLLTTVRDVLSSRLRMVTTRSTRVPGSMNPATPMTSFTFTDMARIPGGIAGGSPAPAFGPRELALNQGLILDHARKRPRLTTASTFEKPPATILLDGQGASRTSRAVTRTPVGNDRAATTTNCWATSTSRTGMRLMAR